VLPGERGNSIIAGHRDTHFRFLQDLRAGDRLAVERANGVRWFVVTGTSVVDSRSTRIALRSDVPRLTLVTCYPFDAIEPGGPLRYVVTAELAKDPITAPEPALAAVSLKTH
jgi:sortase A